MLISDFNIHLTKLFLLIMCLYISFSDVSFLPDFYSYQRIYSEATSGGDWEIGFVAFVILLNKIGVQYNEFRIIVSVIGFILITKIYVRSFYTNNSVQFRSFLSLGWFLIPAVLVMVFLEYYLIRLRAGLGVAIFVSGFVLMLRGSMVSWVFGFILVVGSFFFHQFTALVLSVFFIFPYLWFCFRKLTWFRRVPYFFPCCLVCGVFFIAFHFQYTVRGENLFSPLNLFRFFCLGIVPLIFSIFNFKESRVLRRATPIRFYDVFPSYFIDMYLLFSFSLIIYFILGLTSDTGEALVRVFTLASFPAFASLLLKRGPKEAPISMYILVSNALFFGDTLWL
mgnify:CR=1 FL=1